MNIKSNFEFDNLIKKQGNLFYPCGFNFVIGCDEAGRGPGAGPLYTAAVCFLNPDKNLENILSNLDDSKKLTPKKREELYPLIKENSLYCVLKIEIETIEKMNILNASLFGMKNCALNIIKNLDPPIITLIDGNKDLKDFEYPQKSIIKGDSTSASIAAASILAKVERDNFMKELDKKYPNYGFAKNKGYLTEEHINAIKKFGATKEHRMSFLKNILQD